MFNEVLRILSKAISEPGIVVSLPTKNGLEFLMAVNNKFTFEEINLFFKANSLYKDLPFDPFDFYVFIENDILFINIGDYVFSSFSFGFNDLDLIKETLYKQDYFYFKVIYMDNEKIYTAEKRFEFRDLHKEVIEHYILKKYPSKSNDKIEELLKFEIRKEFPLAFLCSNSNDKTNNLIECFCEKYYIDNINEILDYLFSKFNIVFNSLGYCIRSIK